MIDKFHTGNTNIFAAAAGDISKDISTGLCTGSMPNMDFQYNTSVWSVFPLAASIALSCSPNTKLPSDIHLTGSLFQHSKRWPISILQLRPTFLPPSSSTVRHLLPRRQHRPIRLFFQRPNLWNCYRRDSRRVSGRKCTELLQDGRASR